MKNLVRNISCIIACLLLILLPLNLKADSGFDNSYSSGGGGSSSGGSFNSNTPGAETHSIGNFEYYSLTNSVIIDLVLFLIIASTGVYMLYWVFREIFVNPEKKSFVETNMDIPQAVINAFYIYKDVQDAWSNFDYSKLDKLLTDELYNNYKMQLETLKIKNQKNVMENITLINGKIKSNETENGHNVLVVLMKVQLKDYIISTINNEVVRGSDQEVLEVVYEITLTKDISSSIKNCPSCGSKLNVSGRSTCEYCGATIVQGSNEYVMSKKENKSQRSI